MVIGLDAGGTKLLGASLGDGLELGPRVRHTGPARPRGHAGGHRAGGRGVRGRPGRGAPSGIGVPALVDWADGVSRWSNHLPLDDVPLRDLMTERLGLPVVVDNDGNAAVLAEHRQGAARARATPCSWRMGTGIGGGLVLGGQLYRGARGSRASSATWWSTTTARTARRLPRARLSGGAGVRPAIGVAASARRARARLDARPPAGRAGRCWARR